MIIQIHKYISLYSRIETTHSKYTTQKQKSIRCRKRASQLFKLAKPYFKMPRSPCTKKNDEERVRNKYQQL